MEVCCVKGCPSGRETTRAEAGCSVSFHRFPSDDEIRTDWAAALGDVTWEPSESDRVCSLHFERNDFIINECGESIGQLVSEAVPSLLLDEPPKVIDIEEEPDLMLPEHAPAKDTAEDILDELEDTEDSNSKLDEKKFLHFNNLVNVNKNASREELSEQFNKAFKERFVLRKKMRVLRKKHSKIIERMAKVCEKRNYGVIEGAALDLEAKKKKKSDITSKIRPETLEEVVTYLHTQDLLSAKAISVIRSLLGPLLTESIVHWPKAGVPKENEMEISPVMKTFAKTLLFYSAEAYVMVKELFDLPIPPPSVTRTWYNMGLGLPGWSSEAFLMLKDEIQKFEGVVLNTCVVIGEYDLYASSSFDDHEVRGHIDYGTTGDLEVQNYSENLPLAQSALYFMLVPMNCGKKWKIPLAYFLIDTLSPEEIANLLMECLWRVYNMGSVAVAVVADSSVTSRHMYESLGISFEDLPYPCTSFPHPADGLLDVHIVFDPHHIMDLLRHTWASVSLMVDEKGGAISWKYFTELVKVQETQAGCSEQTDQTATWYWDKTLMRKRLIAQLFTNDVANAIECCCTSLMLPQFTGSESTVHFIRTINKIIELFDIKNLSSMTEKVSEWKKSIVEALNYLFVLRDRTGQGIFATNCKAPFVCLYMNLISILELSKKVPLTAISQLSLNGLEMMFMGIRARTSWECCPTVSKFVNAYSLLLQEEGCSFSESVVKVDNFWWLDYQDIANARKSGLEIVKPTIKQENTPPFPRCLTFYPVLLQNELQRFRSSQLVLVHTVKRVADVLHCNHCIEALQMTYVQDNATLILLRKTCGGFIYPSQGVVEVCALADHHLKTELRTASFDIKHDVYTRRDCAVVQSVCMAVLGSVLDRQRNPFPQLEKHLMECPLGSNHICRLIRVITASFVWLRLQTLRSLCCVPS